MKDELAELKKEEQEMAEDLVKEVRQGFGTYEKIIFMSDLLEKQEQIRNVLDVRTNIMIGINSALAVLILTEVFKIMQNNPALYVAFGTVLLSLGSAILALKPPRFLTKKGQAESLFYHHHINSKEYDDYRQEVYNALNDEERVYDAYIAETYNLTKYSNVPRKLYLYLSIRILIYGFSITILIYLFYAVGNLFAGK